MTLTDSMTSNEAWREQAACRGKDPNTFFPGPSDTTGALARARKLCNGCPVQSECLDYALSTRLHSVMSDGKPGTRVFGIWAGTGRNSRAAMRGEVDDDNKEE